MIVGRRLKLIDTFRPKKKGRHFAEDIFQLIFLYEKCVLTGPVVNIAVNKIDI